MKPLTSFLRVAFSALAVVNFAMVHQQRTESISSFQRSCCESHELLRPLWVKLTFSKLSTSPETTLVRSHGKRLLLTLKRNKETSGAANIQGVLSTLVPAHYEIDSRDVLII